MFGTRDVAKSGILTRPFSKLCPQSDAQRRVASRWALPHISSFFFVSTPDLRAPSADRRETLPRDQKVLVFYSLGPKILGALPPKKLGANNVPNLGRFRTTSKFDREYLRKG